MAAESELTAAATDDEALNPASGSAGLDEEVQSVPIGVSSGRSGGKRPKGPFGDGSGLQGMMRVDGAGGNHRYNIENKYSYGLYWTAINITGK